MNTRNRIALDIQKGACNPHAITNELAKALTECRVEGVPPSSDSAIFLIVHQLCHVLTGDTPGSYEQWRDHMNALEVSE